MRFRYATAVALVAGVLAVPPGGAAAPDAPHGGTRLAAALARRPLAGAEPGFWARVVGADGRVDTARAWRESVRSAAAAARPFARVEGAAEQKAPTIVDVGTAGDFDGDGAADVALLRQTYRVTPVWVLDHVTVEARSGRTGKRLWTKRVTLPKAACEYPSCGHVFSLGYAFATQVGGAAGVEVVLFSEILDVAVVGGPVPRQPLPGGSSLHTFDVITLDGRGTQKWSRHREGRVRGDDVIERIEHLPVVYAASPRLEPGADLDWLYEVTDGVLRRNGGSTTVLGQRVDDPVVDLTKTQRYALNGRTGTDRAIGAAREGAYRTSDQTLVGDLSGDGRDDVVTTPPWWSRDTGAATVSAYRSSDGAPLWQRTATGGDVMIVGDVGDFTGDRRADLVIAAFTLRSGEDSTRFTFVNGATGKTLWSRSASAAAALTGRHPLVAFGTSRRTGGSAVVTVAVYDRRHRSVYTRRLTVKDAHAAAHTEGASLGLLGDLDGDGVADLAVGARVVVTTKTENGTSTRSSTTPLSSISGAAGRALPAYGSQTYALHESLDGRGDDVETDGSTGARIRDGRTGRTLLVVDVGQPITWIVIGTLRADRDRCVDVFVAAYPRNSASIVYGIVSGATGKPLWQAVDGARTTARIRTSARSYRCAYRRS